MFKHTLYQCLKIGLSLICLVSLLHCGGAKVPIKAQVHTRPLQKVTYGNASWYGRQFQGRKTASGERFNMHKLTAAHKKWPFGTQLKVTYLKTGKSVKVRVNDRGPFVHGRILDLSYKAAKEIGLIADGHGRVRIQIVGE